MLHLRKNETYVPGRLLMPSMIIIILIFLYPVGRVLWDSVFRISGSERTFVGLGNYIQLVSDDLFWVAVFNNIKLFLCVPVLVLLSILFSVILFYRIPGWKAYRVLLLIPYILSITVVGIVFDYLLRGDGLINLLLQQIGLSFLARPWLGTSSTALYAIMAVIIWKELGFGIVLFLARLLSIDEAVLEAARIDGAGAWTTTVKILIPELKSVLSFYIIFSLINMLSWMFNYIFIMTRGGPQNSTYILEYYIYQMGIRYRQYGMSSALAVILLIFAIVLVIVQYHVKKRLNTDEEAIS